MSNLIYTTRVSSFGWIARKHRRKSRNWMPRSVQSKESSSLDEIAREPHAPRLDQPVTVSAAARRRMAQAQRARWARVRTESQPVRGAAKAMGSAPLKHAMSASARRKIAAAQRARWAKWKAQQKKAA
jgi:hypothetical protein